MGKYYAGLKQRTFLRKKTYFLILLLLLGKCSSPEAVFPVIPRIEFVEMKPLSISSADSLCFIQNQCFSLTFRFEDGDGDLGTNNFSGPPNVFVTDNRSGLPYNNPPIFYDGKLTFRLPRSLTPETRNQSIQGTISIAMPYLPIINIFGEPDTATFSVYIVDRAGHKSNVITTPPLIVYP
jgi:hypothetical protein